MFATPEMIELRLLDQIVDLAVGQTLEKRFAAQNNAGFLVALWCWLRPPFQLQCANGIWNIDPLPFEFVPNIRAHRVVGLIEPGVIAHVVFDLVSDGVIAELNEENFHRRARSEEHTSELQSLRHLVCRLLLEKKNKKEPD